jgi:hypothetical protein
MPINSYSNAEELLELEFKDYMTIIYRFGYSKIKNYMTALDICREALCHEPQFIHYVKETKRVYVECRVKKNKLYETLLADFSKLEALKVKNQYCKVLGKNEHIFLSLTADNIIRHDESITAIDSLENKGTSQYRLETFLGHKDYFYVSFEVKKDITLYALQKLIRAYIEDASDAKFVALKKFMNTKSNTSKLLPPGTVNPWEILGGVVGNEDFEGPEFLIRRLCFLETSQKRFVIAFSHPGSKVTNAHITLAESFSALSKEVFCYVSTEEYQLRTPLLQSTENGIQEFECPTDVKSYH